MSRQRRMAAHRTDALARRYLGDGVYAAHDGAGIWLTAENGIEATDEILLEPEVLQALLDFARTLR